MRTITFHKNDVHKGNLILINKRYPLLGKGIGHEINLIPACEYNPEILLEVKTASVFTHLVGLLKCRGEILPISGYRTYEEQMTIYEDALCMKGMEFANQYVALPGHSEHQSGLAIDVAQKQENIDRIRPEFPYEGICNVFREKALLHGFVERYQKGKEAVTGIAHEPWHFRYVGYPHSLVMNEYNLVLEEYLDMLRIFPYEGEHFITEVNGQTIEIFYVHSSATLTSINLPKDAIYQISGNNIDGYIVTLWR